MPPKIVASYKSETEADRAATSLAQAGFESVTVDNSWDEAAVSRAEQQEEAAQLPGQAAKGTAAGVLTVSFALGAIGLLVGLSLRAIFDASWLIVGLIAVCGVVAGVISGGVIGTAISAQQVREEEPPLVEHRVSVLVEATQMSKATLVLKDTDPLRIDRIDPESNGRV